MGGSFTRRGLLRALAAAPGLVPLLPTGVSAGPVRARALREEGWIAGHLTGAEAATAALQQQGVGCVFGIPGA